MLKIFDCHFLNVLTFLSPSEKRQNMDARRVNYFQTLVYTNAQVRLVVLDKKKTINTFSTCTVILALLTFFFSRRSSGLTFML